MRFYTEKTSDKLSINMKELKAKEYKKFEDIKHVREDGTEYWLARELAQVLEYTNWQNFTKVIDKAMIACNNSGFQVEYRFTDVDKSIDTPKGGVRKVNSLSFY